MPIDKIKLRQAIKELSKADFSREEKLRRIDNLLSVVKQTEWSTVFSIIEKEKLHLGLFTLRDLLMLFLRFKDYKGLHQLKNRMYIISNRMKSLFSIGWRRFPVGVREKNNRFFRPARINPWPIDDFYGILGSCSKTDAIRIEEIKRTTRIKRGKNFSSAVAPTIEKLHAYPNVSKYIHRRINLILREKNGRVRDEVDKIEEESRPSFRSLFLEVPDELVQVLATTKGIDYSTVEQVLRVLLLCSQSEEEGKPVEMGVILGDERRVNRFLAPQSSFIHGKNLFLREEDWPTIRERISRTADGTGAALIVRGSDGNLGDIRMLPRNSIGDVYSFLTHPLQSDAIGFLVRQSVVRVYFGGRFRYQLILNRKYGHWGFRDLEKICDELEKLAVRKSIVPCILNLIVKICAKVSEEREGAIVIVGDFEEIRPFLLPDSEERITMTTQKPISEMTEDEIIRLLREDGAVIFDKEGRFWGSQIAFVGPGGRHKIARYITEKCRQSLSVVVSHDTTMTIFDRGKKWKEF